MKTIKQRISYAVMGLMAMGFTACTQNEDMAPTLKGQEINATFSVGGMQTRVNTLGHGNNWENEDLISVLQIFGDEDTRTGEYKYVEEKWVIPLGTYQKTSLGKSGKMRIDCLVSL